MNKQNNTPKKWSLQKIDPNIGLLLVVLVAVFAFGSIIRPEKFLKAGNFQSMGKQLSEYGLMALGVGLCMIAGGIDLSSVYVANLCGIVAGMFLQTYAVGATGGSLMLVMVAAVVIALVIGALCGIFNGLLVAYLNIPAMLATLGTYQLYMGIAIVVSKGSTVSGVPKAFTALGNGMFLNAIPYPLLIFVLVALALTFIMRSTKLGTRIYLVGTNNKSSLFAGIDTKSVLVKTYMISGIVAAIAGIISLSRLNSAKADFGSSYTMQTILIAVLGGVNPNGGFGRIPGVAVGVVILQMLSSLLNMFPDISNYYREFVWGAALIFIMIINTMLAQRNTRKLQKATALNERPPDKDKPEEMSNS